MNATTSTWRPKDIPSQTGRRVLITGANSGIGYHAALELARHGATLLFASRDRARGEAALARLRREATGPGSAASEAELVLLDLASLASVREVAARIVADGRPLDLLVNNAGVMAPPKRLETQDGFELQFGTNVLGHFALTLLLLPALRLAVGGVAPRVVTIASIAHLRGKIDFDDLQSLRRYAPMGSYAQTKLADLMFAFELERRLRAAGLGICSLAAHPGVANTNLFQVGDFSAPERAIRRLFGHAIGALLNSDAEGALPTLYAATAPEAECGGYYGPQGFREMRGGDVGSAKISAAARDMAAAKRLWQVCEELTGVQFPV
ncbi:NAD(P)-dependent dehydrogenase, short-chain alcohol dehydrogenase family [Granulicella rosea]|uniref:NAD(P)-dependent dehydrogenase, short-chain alcohol dehydrogenase family n=1 Tax=Granulicella rosea TaxID=474952 RepID=A0A239LL50_9BACT|nr:oxidoreductase [Granulicella rosea]SNT31191.1 NAD(P)-dependent dehydrogenase, short-chain alcohol dehydrogenase family [Granulicella rosea]